MLGKPGANARDPRPEVRPWCNAERADDHDSQCAPQQEQKKSGRCYARGDSEFALLESPLPDVSDEE
ncbi:MAG: hypothetical protein QOD83_3500 [Solirubrobacteraceae bacterium]|nr:hypothetical protein [Solirubrobacteraceae bacterium]